MAAPERAGFLPFTPQLLEKRFWMFGASQVCLGVTHRRSHPHSRVILQGARKEEHCKDKGGKRCSFWSARKTTCSEQPRHQAGYPRTRKSVPLVTREEAAGPSAGGSSFAWPVHSTAGWKLPVSHHTGFNINNYLLYTVRERSHPELLNQA